MRLVPLASALAVTTIIHAAPARASQSYETTTWWDTSVATSVHGDTSASTPVGNGMLWVFADTTQQDGQDMFIHSSFLLQRGTALAPVRGQAIPNMPDGEVVWPTGVTWSDGYVYVTGIRVTFTQSPQGTWSYTVNGPSVSVFAISATVSGPPKFLLTVDVPGMDQLGSPVRNPAGGWVIAGTSTSNLNMPLRVSASAVAYPAVSANTTATGPISGDIITVPPGGLSNPSTWTWVNGAVPADQLGHTLSLLPTQGGWDIFTKQSDMLGTNIERLSAPALTGPWTVTGTWQAPVEQSGDYSYAVQVHPEQSPDQAGDILISYSVNGNSSDYHPLFLYLPSG